MASLRTLAAAIALLLSLNSLVSISSAARQVATTTTPVGHKQGTCQMNLGICVDMLNGLLHWSVGLADTDNRCCAYLGGMVGFEAASCVCTIIKTRVVGMEIDIPLTFDMMFNHCGQKVPRDFRCA